MILIIFKCIRALVCVNYIDINDDIIIQKLEMFLQKLTFYKRKENVLLFLMRMISCSENNCGSFNKTKKKP